MNFEHDSTVSFHRLNKDVPNPRYDSRFRYGYQSVPVITRGRLIAKTWIKAPTMTGGGYHLMRYCHTLARGWPFSNPLGLPVMHGYTVPTEVVPQVYANLIELDPDSLEPEEIPFCVDPMVICDEAMALLLGHLMGEERRPAEIIAMLVKAWRTGEKNG